MFVRDLLGTNTDDFLWQHRQDAAQIGFDDDYFHQQVSLPPEQRHIAMQPLLRNEALAAFKDWAALPDKLSY